MTNQSYGHSWFWTAYYGVWILLFLAPELFWVAVNPNNTLSDQFWYVEHLNMRHPFDFAMWTDVHWAMAALVWTLFLWLSLHLPFGLLR